MSKVKLKDFLVKTDLENSALKDMSIPKENYATEDSVYLLSEEELDEMETQVDEEVYEYTVEHIPTDFAILNNTYIGSSESLYAKGLLVNGHLRSLDYEDGVDCLRCVTDYRSICTCDESDELPIRPAITLDTDMVVDAIKNGNTSLIAKDCDTNIHDEVLGHYIEFGEYPQSVVISEDINRDLNKRATKTGKSYTGYAGRCYEYELDGKKYVKFKSKTNPNNDDYHELSDCSEPVNGKEYWVKVEPIKWLILNYDRMPKEITGGDFQLFVDGQIQLWSRYCLTKPQPYTRAGGSPQNKHMLWQNSDIRGYLNGYDLSDISNKSVPELHNIGDNYSKYNFLEEAFGDMEMVLGQSYSGSQSGNNSSKRNNIGGNMGEEKKVEKEKKGYGVVVEETPLSVKDQMKFYIDHGKSFMLHGASGIGKTRRVEELDPDLVSLVLRKGMLPEEAIGKTIYPNNDTSAGGEWKPPAWYIKLCEEAEKKGDKKQILFLDELTNSLYEQNLVFHLVLNRCIQPNLGRLPDNVVVVAAGNNQEESSSAYNMTEPLFRRFDGHIYLEPNIPEWLEWGSEESGRGDGRLKIHPLISNFVSTYGMKAFYTNYDRDDPPKYAMDPRGWEQVSDIIYDNNGVLAKELIENKVGPEVAKNLIAFAKQPVVSLEDVLEDNYDEKDIPSKYDQKFAMVMSMRHAKEDEIGKVRQFIRDNMGEELLSTFDASWVGENTERALLVDQLNRDWLYSDLKNEEDNTQTQETTTTEVKASGDKVPMPEDYKCKVADEIAIGDIDSKLPIKEFLDMKDLRFIHCEYEWQAKILMNVLNKLNIEWFADDKCSENNTKFKIYGNKTCYSNPVVSGFMYVDSDELVGAESEIYEFDEIDYSEYISGQEIYELLQDAEITNSDLQEYLEETKLPF